LPGGTWETLSFTLYEVYKMIKIMDKYFLGIEIEINHHCNLACTYCPNSTTERKSKGEMSIDQFRTILNQLSDINYEGRITYHFYNEPMLHPELENFVKLSKEILPKTLSELFTNGMFLDEERYYALRAAGIDHFKVTKHKDTKKIAFDKTYANLSDDEKIRVRYRDHSQLIFTNRGGLVEAGADLTEPSKRLCFIPSCSLVVTVKGNIVSCYEDYNETHVMGNIFKEHIKDIWQKPEYIEFRNDLKKGYRYKYDVCKTCNNRQVIQ
jgi:radical SAM protein with 4Fe4S-binding SPASM domain